MCRRTFIEPSSFTKSLAACSLSKPSVNAAIRSAQCSIIVSAAMKLFRKSMTASHRLVRRSQIILASAAGEANTSIAIRLGVSNPTICHKTQLASDRTSCRSALANQMRLVLHTAAYWLMLAVRDAIPKPHELATAEFAKQRIRLLKIAARIIETTSRVASLFASRCVSNAITGATNHEVRLRQRQSFRGASVYRWDICARIEVYDHALTKRKKRLDKMPSLMIWGNHNDFGLIHLR